MAEARTIGDVHHTLSIWQDRRSMLSFLRSDAHRKAIKAFPRIATGKTYGYSATARPDWAEARRLWEVNGREYN